MKRHQKLAAQRRAARVDRLRGAPGGLRRYGPGKFNLDIDGYVHGLTMDGWGDGLGDVQSFGYYHCLDLGRSALQAIEKDAREHKDALTTAEKNLIRGSAGAILEENNQGFVSVEYFPTKRALEKQWAKIERAYEKHEEEYGGDE